MSLLSEAMTACHLLDRRTAPDGYGGYISTWEQGAPFDAAIVYNSSLAARVAEQQGVRDLYTVTTKRNVYLEYHDIFVRDSDGQIFRVTTDGKDNKTPRSAGLDMRNVSAEEYILPDGQNAGA